MSTTPLWKTTLVIWTDYDPHRYEIDDLAREAVSGDAYCSVSKREYIKEPEKDQDWDGTEFFGIAEKQEQNEGYCEDCSVEHHTVCGLVSKTCPCCNDTRKQR